MTERQTPSPHQVDRARSFGAVADAYDRARPAYPPEAVSWLAGPQPAVVLELGAGTGKLTEQLVRAGHAVVATDPSSAMLQRLLRRAPGARAAVAAAEAVPLPTRSVDVVVAAQAFHWFDPARTLTEVTRVLRPDGVLGLVWNVLDERIPWVKRLSRIIDEPQGTGHDPVRLLDDHGSFQTVERATYRFWQPLTRDSLRDLVLSRSAVAVLPEDRRSAVLEEVDRLYDDYGRGHDGMLLPYVTHAFRAVVLPWASAADQPAPEPATADTDALLIDFR